MAIPRKTVNVRLPEPTYKALGRLRKVFDRSQTKLVEIGIKSIEKSWLKHLTEDEKQRYLDGEIDRDEAEEIHQRARTTSQPQPQPLAGVT
jgi:hypothetical protein